MPFRLGDSDSGGGSDGLPLTNDDETSIAWGDFATVTLGIWAGEFYSGVARFLASVLNAFIIDPINGAGEFAASFIGELVGRPSTFVWMAFSETERWVAAHPIVGFVVGLGIVFVIAFAASRVIPRG